MSLDLIDKLMLVCLFLMTWACIWASTAKPKKEK